MSKPTTILFLLKRVDCNDGVSAYLETIVRGLQKHGHKIVIVSGPVRAPGLTLLRRLSIESAVVEWLVTPALGSLTTVFQATLMVRECINKHAVDVISPQGFALLPFAFLLSVITGKITTANYHGGSASHVGSSGSMREKIYYGVVGLLFGPKQFISMSTDTTKFLVHTCRIHPRRIVEIPFGVDISVFRPPTLTERQAAREKFGLADNTLVCVHSGRVSEDKGQPLVIEAVRMLRRSYPSVSIVCLFAGSMSEGENILAQAHKEDGEKNIFRFLDHISKSELQEVYWAADIVLLPSRLEGFGASIAEGMASACVPIRTFSGGAADQILEGVTGFIVPFNDASAIASCIVNLMDSDRLQRMKMAASAHVQKYLRQDLMISNTSKAYGNNNGVKPTSWQL